MATVEDKVAALTSKLEAMEALLQQQQQAHPDTSAEPSTSSSSSVATPIRVTVPRERKFGKYGGTRDDRILEDWIADARRAVQGQADGDAVDNLLFHLEGVAKVEVKLRPTAQWSSPQGVFTILREAFSEQLTQTQAMRKFFARCQGEKESVQDFAHALMVLLGRVERLSGEEMQEKDRLLREQLIENLRDHTLRRDIKRWGRDHPEATYQEVRLEVHRYMEEDPYPRRSAAARETVVDEADVEAVEATRRRVLSDLVSGQKLLAEEVQRQQKTLMSHIEQQRQVLTQQQQTLNQLLAAMAWRPRPSGCYNCGEEGHFARECQRRPSDSQQGQRRRPPPPAPKKKEPALNDSTPPQ